MHAPHFAPGKVVPQFAWPGERAFSWAPSATKRCWVSVIPSSKGYNEFSIEIGWSSFGRYPELQSRPSIAATEQASDVFHLPEFMCNLASVGKAPAFWRVAPTLNSPAADPLLAEAQAVLARYSKQEAVVTATPLVTSAMQALLQYGLPFLVEYAA